MQFTKKLRDGVRRGDITCSVRIWKRPHVKVGNRYALAPGEIEVDAIHEISLEDITPELAVRSGFPGLDFSGPELFFTVGDPEGLLCGARVDSLPPLQ